MSYRTPLIADSQNVALFLKCEHHLPGGSYKARGIETFLASLPPKHRKLRVLSAGNMARTLALLAQPRGLSVEALVPDSIPEIKREKLEALGVLLRPIPFAELWKQVVHPQRDSEFCLVHPVDTPELLQGYGGIVSEILKQQPDLAEVVVPLGVGGLTLGISRALRQLAPHVRVVVAENEETAPLFACVRDPMAQELTRRASWIDAIGTPFILPRVKEQLLGGPPLIDEIRTVTPAAALQAGKDLLHETGELVEGAAAVALAAARGSFLRCAEISRRPRRRGVSVVILTGKNIDRRIYA